jgi:transcription antitermination factor NusG
MKPPDREAVGLFQVGDKVSISEGMYAGQDGVVVGHHWKASYPMVRLIVYGRETDVWFHESEMKRVCLPL